MTDPPAIRIRKDGPYVVTGLPVRRLRTAAAAAGDPVGWVSDHPIHGTEQTALCRCGRSAIKPFCDGTHRGQFDGTETASIAGADDQAGDLPPTEVTPTAELAAGVGVIDNGPLWVTGSVPLQLSDGRTVAGRARITLCRCGCSRNKPYCDGTHREVGFTDAGGSGND